MKAEGLSAVVYNSRDPERLAAFYREHLGIPFEAQSHGPMRNHLEAWMGGIHFAILKGRGPGEERGAVAPTFRVKGLDRFMEALERSGVHPLHQPADLGEGKRLVSFLDLDGNRFQLIDVGQLTELPHS